LHRLIRLRREKLPDGVRAVAWVAVSSVIVWVSSSVGPAQRASAARMALRSIGVSQGRILVAVPFIALGVAWRVLRSHPVVTALTATATAFSGGLATGVVMLSPVTSSPSAAPPSVQAHRRRPPRVVEVPSPYPVLVTAAPAPDESDRTKKPHPSQAAGPQPSVLSSPSPSVPVSVPPSGGCLLSLDALGLNVTLLCKQAS
jgi:hypothetical protein